MLWFVTGFTFFATVLILMALVYAFSSGGVEIAGRLSRLLKPADPVLQEEPFSGKQLERARNVLVSVGKMFPAPKGKQLSKAQLVAIRAGFRGEEALVVLRGVRVLLALALLATVFFTGVYVYSPLPILAFAGLAGFMIPEIWIIRRMRARQRRMRQGLPDAMDLLVICVEVGLGLDQSILKVAEELQIAHPDLSQELQMVNLEMRVGKTRVEALRELAERTGLEDLKALVSMLIQTDRFGTNIAQSLRVFSDELRTKRRQRAEELSAKTSVKMMAPLVFLIFPALMVVIVGPAVISLMRQLLPAMK